MTIKYKDTARGDILRLVGAGAPGYMTLGDLVRVLSVEDNGLLAEDQHGVQVNFVFNCGADRLEATEWRNDFPVEDEE